MKKIIITLLCIAIAAGGGCFGYTQYQKSQDNKKAVDVVPVNLMTQSADMIDYSYSEMEGQIISSNSQKIYLDNQKLVKKIHVKEGDEVKKGDVILSYDMTVVELELAQKENQLKVIESNIKTAKKEIENYKTYKPFEDAPKESDNTPDIPEEPDIPDDNSYTNERPKQPIETAARVGASFKTNNQGTQDDPFVINCSENTIIEPVFLSKIINTNKYAELHVYDQDSNFIYMWIINKTTVKTKEFVQWNVSEGVSLNLETGMIAVDPSANHFGFFSANLPETASDNSADESGGNNYSDDYFTNQQIFDNYDDGETNESYLDNQTDRNNHDYEYTKAEITKLISDKQAEIKELELDKKAAKLELENSKKQKSDGKVVASIDGIVKKIGEADASQNSSEENDTTGGDSYGEDNESEAFAVIEGEGGVSVQADISELELPKLEKGSSVTVKSWETGSSCNATVTSLSSEPASYTSYNWGENPNNSTYSFTAKLDDGEDFNIGDWVSVSLDSNNDGNSDSVYMPIHYLRRENGDYYMMKADSSNKLVKQYVKTGKIMYGSYIEVRAGLSMSDRICFPYGKDVKEGVKTQDSTEVLYPDDMMY